MRAPTATVEYLYDGAGRRLSKTVTLDSEPEKPLATFYVWDEWTVLQEVESVRNPDTGLWEETVTAEYLPGMGLDGPGASPRAT